MQVGSHNVLLAIDQPAGHPNEALYVTIASDGGTPVRVLRHHDMAMYGQPLVSPIGIMLGIPLGLPVVYNGARQPFALKNHGWIDATESVPTSAVMTGFGFIDCGQLGGNGVIVRTMDDGQHGWVTGELVTDLESKATIILSKFKVSGSLIELWSGYRGPSGWIYGSLSNNRIGAAYASN